MREARRVLSPRRRSTANALHSALYESQKHKIAFAVRQRRNATEPDDTMDLPRSQLVVLGKRFSLQPWIISFCTRDHLSFSRAISARRKRLKA